MGATERGRMNETVRYLDPDGNPLTASEWAEMFERRGTDEDDSWWRKRTVGEGWEVLTDWIGLNHAWETMIFGGEHDSEQWRHASRDAALAAHEQIVAALRDGKDPSA
jgi:hypothetical protein